jgi:conjugative transfer region protein TrbK
MLDRSDIFRAAAIVALIACFIAALVAINRRPSAPVAETFPTVTAPATDDLTDELRRCSALGPKDAVDARCEAVWEENRRRFFGRPARPLPPQTSPSATAPATPAATDTTRGDAR